MQKHEDAAITTAVLQGDINRYAELLDKYQENIYAIVARRAPEIAVPGITHDVFVQAYQSLKGYSGAVPFGNWAARIAIRSCCNYWRQRARHDSRMVCPELNGSHREWLEQAAICKTTEEADHLIKQQEAVSTRQWLLAQLSPEDKTMIESVYIDEMPLKEVAAALGWGIVKTKVRALRARRKMRQLLKQIGELS